MLRNKALHLTHGDPHLIVPTTLCFVMSIAETMKCGRHSRHAGYYIICMCFRGMYDNQQRVASRVRRPSPHNTHIVLFSHVVCDDNVVWPTFTARRAWCSGRVFATCMPRNKTPHLTRGAPRLSASAASCFAASPARTMWCGRRVDLKIGFEVRCRWGRLACSGNVVHNVPGNARLARFRDSCVIHNYEQWRSYTYGTEPFCACL